MLNTDWEYITLKKYKETSSDTLGVELLPSTLGIGTRKAGLLFALANGERNDKGRLLLPSSSRNRHFIGIVMDPRPRPRTLYRVLLGADQVLVFLPEEVLPTVPKRINNVESTLLIGNGGEESFGNPLAPVEEIEATKGLKDVHMKEDRLPVPLELDDHLLVGVAGH